MFKFDTEVYDGNRNTHCWFTIKMKGDDIEDIEIDCSAKPKRKMRIKDFVWTSKTMQKFSLSFTIKKSKIEMTSSAVETG